MQKDILWRRNFKFFVNFAVANPKFWLFTEFFLHQKFFIWNSIIWKIYIFLVKNIFPFQKKFLYAIKKFFWAEISFFVAKKSSIFFRKNRQKSPKKFFQSVFWPKCEKKFDQGSRRTFRNHQFGFGKLWNVLKKKTKTTHFFFFFLSFFFCFQNFFLHGFFLFQIL